MELIGYWRVIRRWAWLIILCPLVAALAAGLISLELPKIYEAQVSILVRPAQVLPTIGGLPTTPDQILRTYATLMTERPRLEQVISDLGLRTDPVTLSHEISVTPEPNTLILKVAVRDSDPERARNLANTLVTDVIAHVKEIQKSEAAAPTTSSADNLVVESPAILPTEPVSPRPLLNMALALLAGLLVGLGLAFLFDYLDQSVRSDEILRERVGLAPLGHISYVAAKPQRRGELVT